MKFKYDNETKVIIAMGSHVGAADPEKETIEDTDMEIPNESLRFYKRTSLGIFERRSQEEIDLILSIANFNVIDFSESLLTRFMASEFTTPAVRFEWGALKQFAEQKTAAGWTLMKQYLQSLVPGTYQQQDFDAINNSCKEQGVDLDMF